MLARIKIIISLSAAGFNCTLASGVLVWFGSLFCGIFSPMKIYGKRCWHDEECSWDLVHIPLLNQNHNNVAGDLQQLTSKGLEK